MPPKSTFRDPTSETLLTAARQTSTPHKPTDFTQSDLLSLNVCKTVDQLLHPLNDLVRIGHFILLTSSPSSTSSFAHSTRPPTYRLRPAGAVSTLSSLSSDARRCYEMIESAGSAAIWSKTIQMRTKMPQIVVTKSLKALEVAKLVKQMKNVKMPNRRMYLLAGLKPSEEATGGSWFSEGELDEGLVEGVAEKIVEFVEGESWRVGGKKAGLPKEKEDNVGGNIAPWDETAFYTVVNRRRYPLLPHPADYKDYPTAADARTFIDSLNIVQDKDITVPDMQALMDVMEWDGRIERMGLKKEAVDQDVEEDSESGSGDESGSDGEGSDIEAPGTKRKRTGEGEAAKKRQKRADGDVANTELANDDAMNHETDADIIDSTEPKAKPVVLMHDVPMYRSVRQPFGYDHNKGPGSAFAETPCSRCPVFDLCEDSGPINARDCGYLPGWLAGAKA